MNKKVSPILTGIILMMVGIVILFNEMDVIDFSWNKTWPLVLVAVSLFNLIKVLSGQKKEIFGVILFGTLGTFFLLRNYGVIYDFWFDEFWPIFLIAPGLGFIGLFIVNPKDWGALIPGLALLSIGGFWGLQNFDVFERFLDAAEIYWPLILVVAGIALVVYSLRKDHVQH